MSVPKPRVINLGQKPEYIHCMAPAGLPFGALCGATNHIYPVVPHRTFTLLVDTLQCPECVEYIHA